MTRYKNYHIEIEIEIEIADPQHDSVLKIEKNLLLLPIVADKRVQRIAVWNPTDEAGVRRQRNNRVALDSKHMSFVHSHICLNTVKQTGFSD